MSRLSASAPAIAVSRARSAVRAAWRAAVPRALALVDVGRRVWRRSLQLRMVTITLLVSGLLVGTFGYLVAEQITDAILRSKQVRAGEQVARGGEDAGDQLQVHSQPTDPELPRTLTELLTGLAGSSQHGGVVVGIRSSPDAARLDMQASDHALQVDRAVSDELRRSVVAGNQSYQYVTADIGLGARQYLVFGTPVPSRLGLLELYYLFPLDEEVGLAGRVGSTVAATGSALVLLLAVVAALVTRLVVSPVRIAARTAQRLSAGLLDQRMTVNGEDDLALLAASFNQMAANLQRQIVRLEEMSRLQRRFTSDVSHELRTPLTTVRMAADLIFAERGRFHPAVARSAELLQTELDRFESLLTDLLEVSRFDAGFAMLDAEPTDLAPVVRRVIERLDPLASVAEVDVRMDLPSGPVIVEVDARRVERILRNLVGNAVEHGAGHPVEVTLAADASAVAVTVRDRGVGLQPGEDKLVFNRFWRADMSRARQTGGTGLGLSISLEDARLHGGWLEAWGAPGRGAQFRLTLPIRAGDRLTGSPLRLVPDDAYPEPADRDADERERVDQELV